MLGQYAILSHCWDQDNSQELIFDDVAHISDPRVLAKSGFSKLQGFTKVVKSRYGCRYLWMDTACIEETDRDDSIPLMFGWYRHAYICVVYLSTSAILGDRWVTRGWTLQELLAADKIVFFTNSWVRLKAEDVLGSKFHACREILSYSSVYEQLKEIIGYLDWAAYQPGVDQALDVLFAMRARETTKPEDRVYSLLSSLNISISIEYGEGFERAFYRLQAEILIQGQDRRLLLWKGWKGWESSYNSMLSNHFDSWLSGDFEEYRSSKYSSSFDPTITFDSNNVMRIMVFLYRLYSSPSHVFMLLGRYTHSSSYVGILLWEFPGNIYRRIGYKEHNSRISFDKPPEWIYIK